MDATQVLVRARDGDAAAAADLMPMVYAELRALAGHYLAREQANHTLQPTALVHEAYLKLVDQTRANYEDRTHFFAVAAEAMRRVLVDYARRRAAVKRGAGWERVTLDHALGRSDSATLDAAPLDDALDRLARLDATQARIVELRFFGGLGNREIASILGLSLRTVENEWRMARAWLRRTMQHERTR
ncbi:MAG: sigma-70 family RNA polymerase sigma factor [Planctomycetota bacterium]|nr:MAG: sigma-70 family RNA polymerase sigma factor [Planctomycetota bacterium]